MLEHNKTLFEWALTQPVKLVFIDQDNNKHYQQTVCDIKADIYYRIKYIIPKAGMADDKSWRDYIAEIKEI